MLADRSAGTRLARLLEPPRLDVPRAASRECDALIDGHGPRLRRFLERAPLHGWHRGGLGSEAPADATIERLGAVARRFDEEFADHHHVLIVPAADGRVDLAGCTSVEFRNGTRAMVIGSRPGAS